jgi:hypothetical protein
MKGLSRFLEIHAENPRQISQIFRRLNLDPFGASNGALERACAALVEMYVIPEREKAPLGFSENELIGVVLETARGFIDSLRYDPNFQKDNYPQGLARFSRRLSMALNEKAANTLTPGLLESNAPMAPQSTGKPNSIKSAEAPSLDLVVSVFLDSLRYEPRFIVVARDIESGLGRDYIPIGLLQAFNKNKFVSDENYNKIRAAISRVEETEEYKIAMRGDIEGQVKAFIDGLEKIRSSQGGLDGGGPITPLQEESNIPNNGRGRFGGIDFRALPITTQPMGELLMKEIINMPVMNVADLDQEWQAMQKMIEAEACPSTQRIKEFLGACYQKGELKQRADKVLACLAGILRMEEDESKATEPQVKVMLALLEYNR